MPDELEEFDLRPGHGPWASVRPAMPGRSLRFRLSFPAVRFVALAIVVLSGIGLLHDAFGQSWM